MRDDPYWLVQLRYVRVRNGENLSERELADRAHLSHTTVSNIFAGIGQPRRETIAKLVAVLTEDPAERQAAMLAFDSGRPSHKGFETRTDNQLLIDGIGDLASVIEGLTVAITLNTNALLALRPKPDHQ